MPASLVHFSYMDLQVSCHCPHSPCSDRSPTYSHIPAVLYHPSSGQICHAPGQDPSHLDDDITQYMWHGLLRPMVYSSEEVLPSVCPFSSEWIASIQIASI